MTREAKANNCELCGAVETCFLEDTLPPDVLADFRGSHRPMALRPGEVLFREGDQSTGIWVICAGRIKVSRQGHDGKPLIIRVSHAGELIGYRSFFAGQPFMGTGEAMEKCLLFFLDRHQVEQFLATHGRFWLLLLRRLARDLGHAEAVAANMAYQCSRDRVFGVLSELYHTRGWNDPKRNSDILTIRRKDLAELAGLTVETTVRVLKELERTGLLEIKGRQIRIVDIGQFDALLSELCSV